jgi:flagellar motor protein MotB
MAADYARMKAVVPELDKAKAELKKYREKESRQQSETAWLLPAVDVLTSGLGDELRAGKAEVFAADRRIIVNIREDAVYLPGSYTFSKESPGLRLKLASLLRKDEFKDKRVFLGNTTEDVPASGRGRRKIPPKDARTLAAERSAALVKDLEKNGVSRDALVAAAFSSKQPGIGDRLKTRKVVILIEAPLAEMAAVPERESAKSAQAKPAPPGQPKAIPIQPARPR